LNFVLINVISRTSVRAAKPCAAPSLAVDRGLVGFLSTPQKPHPKTLMEIAMVLSMNSSSFPSNSHVSETLSILIRFGGFWNPTNSGKINADGSLMGRTNLDKFV